MGRTADRGGGRAGGRPGIEEEIFGPVVTITPFSAEDEAIALANDTRYGLNAMLFTENLSRAHRVSAALQDRDDVGQLLLHP